MTDQNLSAEDRLEVMDLIARYSRCLDTADVEGFLEIFRPEAVIDSLSGVATGHDELRAWVNRLFDSRGVGATPPAVIHFVGLPLIEGYGDRARAQTYTIILDYNAAGLVQVAMLGRYDDECVRVDGRWWIQRRVIHSELSNDPAASTVAPTT